MDYRSWICTLVLVLFFSPWEYGAGHSLADTSNVTVVMWDGEVTITWVPPVGAPPLAHYKVTTAKYTRTSLNWTVVPGCEFTMLNSCKLTDVITDIKHYYVAEVRLATKQNTSEWKLRSPRFTLKDSQLKPPVFTLSVSPTSVKIRVHRTPALGAVFGHGLKYLYYLREKGMDKEWNVTEQWEEYKNGRTVEENEEFKHLQWGQEYCVRAMVKFEMGIAVSQMSPEQCIILPEPDWYRPMVLTFIALGALAALASLVKLCCFLKRPEKLPSTLKSPGSNWHPLSLNEVPVEVVMNKGWLLTSQKTEGKGGKMAEKMRMAEKEEGEERRGSMDSGVSMDQPSSEKDGEEGRSVMRQQEDSGCGSLGESDSNSSNIRGVSGELPLLDGKNSRHGTQQKEGSGMGVGCQYSGAQSMEGKDYEHPPEVEVVMGDGYRCQIPSFVAIQANEKEEARAETPNDTDNSIVIAVGYRPSQPSCVCSEKGICFWCQSSTTSHTTNENSMCSYPTTNTSDQFPTCSVSCVPDSYPEKNSLQTEVELRQRDTSLLSHVYSTDSSECAPLLISVPQLPLLYEGLQCSANALSLSLQDAELTFG
ncbi:interleukin-10 receptor subunit alpha [Megalops cyprinoides]|uniref:interleukin-10 receptor subunit alpha n=1 Tax=Megalops cyprinoides TaxID=118141 RepID=UPI001865655B|nr:interleukin-10 receptor subunit alpha [Megalops cyprinoides]